MTELHLQDVPFQSRRWNDDTEILSKYLTQNMKENKVSK